MTENAKIRSTHLGKEDHGIMTAYLSLDFGGGCQSFGGFAFEVQRQIRRHNANKAFTADMLVEHRSKM